MLRLTHATVDLASGAVERDDGASVRLTSTERALLAYLVAHPDEALPRARLLGDVWGYAAAVSSRTLDTAVKTLRRKIEGDSRQPDHVHTEWGTGYRFSALAVLPPAPTALAGPLVGRQALLAELRGATEALVTLVGIGGVGKSRLAAEAFADACSVSLATVAPEVDAVDAAVAVALPAGGSTVERLRACPLLVLDEVESVIDPVRSLVPDWLRQVPGLRVVCTSQRPLRVAG
ncbi:MAG: winged helix-turn-helix domain-containing protein, partial [Myxococcota bacterium]